MTIKKLKYSDKETAIKDLIAKGAIYQNGNYQNGTHSVVHVGKIVDIQGTYDEEGKTITEPKFIDGWHVDIMIGNDIEFDNELHVENPVHKYFGL